MISKFKLSNVDIEEESTFGQESGFDYLYKSDDIDWGYAEANHSTYSYPGQIGETISSTKVKPRQITIKAYCYYLPDKYIENKRELVYNEIKKKKAKITRIINPNQIIRIVIDDYYIEGKPDQSIKFGATERENNVYFCSFFISIYCPDPLFKKNTITRSLINGSIPKFHFPLVFPKGKGIILSERKDYKMIAVENEGSVETGCVLIFEALGEVSNPVVENIQNGQKLKISKTMVKGERIIVNTSDGEAKSVKGILNGEENDYFKYWSFDNDWIKIPVGTSLIGYSVDDDNESLIDIKIEINPMKYGLEEM